MLLIFTAPVSYGFINSENSYNNWEYDLFKIGRSRDANEIIYSINFDQPGHPDKSDPIEIHWIKRTNNNKVEPLTWIQKKYAYGIKFLNELKKEDEIYFQFVSYDKRTFILKKNVENCYKVFTISGEKEVEVSRIFIEINGGSFWLPTVSRVELHGKEPGTGNLAMETINP
ncbi:MAG: hypothetical protein A2X04_00535 [Bacteroidetes bacterium GWF2_41_9]|nr:MAG: hypothetical protein A2X04_00535 [Bacteroidetes bacterium GWF2_41_9]